MKQWITVLLASVALLVSASALAATKQTRKLDDATTVLRQFVDIPENAIPPALLRQAHGIAVIPSVFKAGFVVGGRHGRGVLSVRTRDGSWSNPSFISLTGGSLGWQIGASSSDVILVFKSQRSVDRIADGQFSLGADASVAAGPVGRSAGASTNADFNAEVYSYSRSRGLFAGISLEGGRISIDQEANWRFYDQTGLDAYDILRNGDHSGLPESGERFIYTLDRYLPSDDDSGDESSADRNRDNRSDRGSTRDNDEYGRGKAVPYRSDSGGITVEQGNYEAADNDGNTGARNNSARSSDYGSGKRSNDADTRSGPDQRSDTADSDYGSDRDY